MKRERADIQPRGVRGRSGVRSEVVVGQRMPKRCVAVGCSNVTNLKEGISLHKLGSLSTRVFETRTATGREHFTCQDSGVSQIFVLIISNGEKILSNVNLVV